MIKLIVDNIENYNYTLKDENNNLYELNLEFYDLDKRIKIGDTIYLPKQLLNEKGLYSFGVIKRIDNNLEEYIKLIIDNKQYYLERYYG